MLLKNTVNATANRKKGTVLVQKNCKKHREGFGNAETPGKMLVN